MSQLPDGFEIDAPQATAALPQGFDVDTTPTLPPDQAAAAMKKAVDLSAQTGVPLMTAHQFSTIAAMPVVKYTGYGDEERNLSDPSRKPIDAGMTPVAGLASDIIDTAKVLASLYNPIRIVKDEFDVSPDSDAAMIVKSAMTIDEAHKTGDPNAINAAVAKMPPEVTAAFSALNMAGVGLPNWLVQKATGYPLVPNVTPQQNQYASAGSFVGMFQPGSLANKLFKIGTKAAGRLGKVIVDVAPGARALMTRVAEEPVTNRAVAMLTTFAQLKGGEITLSALSPENWFRVNLGENLTDIVRGHVENILKVDPLTALFAIVIGGVTGLPKGSPEAKVAGDVHNDALQKLGLKPEATQEEIQQAFQEKMPPSGPVDMDMAGNSPHPDTSETVAAEQSQPSAIEQIHADATGAKSLHDIGSAIGTHVITPALDAVVHVRDSARRIRGEMFPTVSRLDRESGEAAARFVSSREYAKEAAPVISMDVIGGRKSWSELWDTDLDVKAGAVLVQDNLDSIRQTRAEAEGPEAASGVRNVWDMEGAPFKNEAEYRSALNDPEVKSVIDRYKNQFMPIMDDLYKKAQRIDPSEQLPTRGAQTGARVNLKWMDRESKEAKAEGVARIGSTGTGNLRASLMRKSPFARKATGEAEAYDLRLSQMIENSLYRSTEIANRNAMYDQLVASGLAQFGRPGEQVTINGKPTQTLPTKGMSLLVKDAKGNTISVPSDQVLYIREGDLYKEIRRAVGVDQRASSTMLKAFNNATTKLALASLGEASAHTINITSRLLLAPGGDVRFIGSFFKNAWNLAAHKPEAMRLAVELARIGAARSRGMEVGEFAKWNPQYWMGRFLQAYHKIGTMTLSENFDRLVKAGVVENNEGVRRDFVNQIGQYNIRAQHAIVAGLRSTGLGPFATAATNFYSWGLRSLVFAPGVKAASTSAAVNLRARVFVRTAAIAGLAPIINYLAWGRADGGSAVVPFGAVRLPDDKDGKVQWYDPLRLLGIRRGLRATGAQALFEGLRTGQNKAEISKQALEDMTGAALAPAMGPSVTALTVAATGYNPHLRFQVSKKANTEESQQWLNVKAAALQANPIVGATAGIGRKPLPWYMSVVSPFLPTEKAAKSPAEILASRLQSRVEQGSPTPQEEAYSAWEKTIYDLKTPEEQRKAVVDAYKNKTISPKQMMEMMNKVANPLLVRRVKALEWEKALRVWRISSEEERKTLRPVMLEKMVNAMDGSTKDGISEIRQEAKDLEITKPAASQ